VNAIEPLDRLHLEDHFAVDHNVEAISTVDLQPTIHKRKGLLPLDDQPIICQLECQACFVRRFQQTRSEYSMNPNGCANNAFGQCIQAIFHAQRECNSRASSSYGRFPEFFRNYPSESAGSTQFLHLATLAVRRLLPAPMRSAFRALCGLCGDCPLTVRLFIPRVLRSPRLVLFVAAVMDL
jgi:hypothetical protein